MTADRQAIHIDRRLIATFLTAWGSVGLAWALQEPGLVLVGMLLAGIAAFGSVVPARPALHAEFDASLPTPTEGDEFMVRTDLSNKHRGVLAEWKLQLPDTAQVERGETNGFALLHAHGDTRFTAEIKTLLFGLHRIGPMHLRIGDPFGFVSVEETTGRPQDIRVYPRYDRLKETIVKSRQQRPLLGRYEISKPGYGMEFYGLRGYMHGDRPRDINWKASARSDDIIVNQHEKETNTEAVVLVDVRAGTRVGQRLQSPFAQGCRAALSIADSHLKIQDPVKFIAYGDGVITDRHTGATRMMQGILDILVGLEPKGNTTLGAVVHDVLPTLRPHTPVFVVTSLVGDPSVHDALVLLKSHGFPVSVFVPAPEWGDGAEAADAGRVWQAMQDKALSGLRETGIPVVRFDPGQSIDEVIGHLEVMR